MDKLAQQQHQAIDGYNAFEIIKQIPSTTKWISEQFDAGWALDFNYISLSTLATKAADTTATSTSCK